MKRSLIPALLLVAVAASPPVLGAGAQVGEATRQQRSEAGKVFRQGDDHYDAGRLDEALAAYRQSYDIVASPNSRLMIARSLRGLGRLGEAYAEMQAVLEDARQLAKKRRSYKSTVEAAETELKEIEALVGFVSFELKPGTTLRVNERELADTKEAIPLPAGALKVDASHAGETRSATLQLAAGARETLRWDDMKPPPTEQEPAAREAEPGGEGEVALSSDDPPPFTTLALVSGGVGVLGLVSFAVFGSLNNSTFSDLEDKCSNKRCPPNLKGDADTGQTYQTIANVSLVVGLVGLGAAATFFYLGSQEETQVGLGPGSVHVRGTF